RGESEMKETNINALKGHCVIAQSAEAYATASEVHMRRIPAPSPRWGGLGRGVMRANNSNHPSLTLPIEGEGTEPGFFVILRRARRCIRVAALRFVSILFPQALKGRHAHQPFESVSPSFRAICPFWSSIPGLRPGLSHVAPSGPFSMAMAQWMTARI